MIQHRNLHRRILWLWALAALAVPGTVHGQSAPGGDVHPDNLSQPAGTETVEAGSLGHLEKRGSGDVHLLLIPGAGFGWSAWEEFMERNADRYTMWAVTPPGYDDTAPPPMPGDLDMTNRVWTDGLMAGLADALAREGMQRPVVVGHHLLGDYYAMRFALEHPDRVAGLAVVGGMPTRPEFRPTEQGGRRPATEAEKAETVHQTLVPQMRHQTREEFRENQLPPTALSRDPDYASELYRRQIDNPVSTQLRYFMEWATSNLAPRLGELTVPMLVIQPRPWASLEEYVENNREQLRRAFGDDVDDLRSAVLERFGSWENLRDATSGVTRWRRLPSPPERLEVEPVDGAAQFVMHDAPETFDRLLADWIGREVATGRR